MEDYMLVKRRIQFYGLFHDGHHHTFHISLSSLSTVHCVHNFPAYNISHFCIFSTSSLLKFHLFLLLYIFDLLPAEVPSLLYLFLFTYICHIQVHPNYSSIVVRFPEVTKAKMYSKRCVWHFAGTNLLQMQKICLTFSCMNLDLPRKSATKQGELMETLWTDQLSIITINKTMKKL